MDRPHATDEGRLSAAREKLLDAALPHVVFDGWSGTTLRAAAAEAGIDQGLARLAFPRGGIDIALAFHRRIDHELAEALDKADLDTMRVRDRIAFALRKWVELMAGHREAVRRGASLFALPLNAPEGARAIWETADLVWRHAGDEATDYNWYTKRAILASVVSATILYWLGDKSTDFANTQAFIDRRIEGVMQIEKTRAAFRENPVAQVLFWGPSQLLRLVRPPISRPGPTVAAGRSYAEEWPGTTPVSVGGPLPD